MRPVVLDMDGFASFRDKATVDFTGADYFAFVGPTGSGKSTVIDAMTFALYGTVPRWQDKRMVMYALAPTAVRGTVRLVFDVDQKRYVVARELRRAKGGGVQIKSARLERLLDPTTLGTINDPTDVMAADGAVTAAVEQLLGLTFEHFCQSVVLPQGEFAEFLRAKGSDRRAILLKLLGAGLYAEIGKTANSRASLAGQRATLLNDQLGGFTDATTEAEAIAVERESALTALSERLDGALLSLRVATAALADATIKHEKLTAEHAILTSVTIPPDAAELDTAMSAARLELLTAQQAEASAQHKDTVARNLLAAAPDRSPLEQARRDHAEHSRLLSQMPAATSDVESAAVQLEQATIAVDVSSGVVDSSRVARDTAVAVERAAGAEVARLDGELEKLSAVKAPAGLAAIDKRAKAAARQLQSATEKLGAAEAREATATAAVEAAPKRTPLETALTLVRELTESTAGLKLLDRKAARAKKDHQRAQDALAAAIARLDEARTAREEVHVASGAAALRPHLTVGDACPVCEQTVLTLPPLGDVPELAAADKAVTAAETTVAQARGTDSAAAQSLATVTAQLATVTDRIAKLRSRLGDHPADETSLRDALANLDHLEADGRNARIALVEARAAHAAAQSDVRKIEADSAAIRSSLGSARDPLVVLGAPAVDDSHLFEAWTQLVQWSADQGAIRRADLQTAHSDHRAAQSSLAGAEKALAAAETELGSCRRAQTEATAAHEGAKATLKARQARLGELVESLADAPSDREAEAQLTRIDELVRSSQDAYGALSRARAALQQAELAVETLRQADSAAWQQLRAARDPLVPLGAPDLPDGSALTGWTALLSWSMKQARTCSGAIPLASQAVVAATVTRDDAAQRIIADFEELDIVLPTDDVSRTAPVAAAKALTRATAEVASIAERRKRAATLIIQRDTAETEQQVARLLGTLLRSDQFPEWLEAAALDTLVADASVRLAELSNGQFELTHRTGEFFVIDHADADSQRGVRTLSGGETFQASLALALALSTQLSSMAAAGAARLDSIFLDEGFGTLDESTLEIVAGTLESLAQGERMVGVVTHVAALAERVPVRFVVNRDSRTSSISREMA